MPKNYKAKTVIGEKLFKTLLYKKAACKCWWKWHLWSISPAFYNNQLMYRYSIAEKMQSQTVRREKLSKTIPNKKSAHKMLVKLTLVINFTSNLQAAYVQIFCCQKNAKPSCKRRKAAQNNSIQVIYS